MADFAHAFARRTRLRGGDELTAILAGSPPGVLSMTGGFPNPATFPTDEVDEIAARLVREDAAVALQYTPCAGIASVREYLIDRQEQLQGRRPERAELIVTSGGMECIALMCQALIDPGDTIAVEAPSYLGALMAFGGAEADVVATAMDDVGGVGSSAGSGDRGRGRECWLIGGRGCSARQPAAGSVLSLWKAASSSAAHGQSCWRRSLPRRPWNASLPATCSSR
jgi:hypothetical protein